MTGGTPSAPAAATIVDSGASISAESYDASRTGVAISADSRPYDPSPEREKMRGYLALGLVLLLVGLVGLIFIVFVTFRLVLDADAATQAFKDMVELLQLLFGPVATLVGTVIGFYFGGKKD